MVTSDSQECNTCGGREPIPGAFLIPMTRMLTLDEFIERFLSAVRGSDTVYLCDTCKDLLDIALERSEGAKGGSVTCAEIDKLYKGWRGRSDESV